ncbi:MAG: FecR domain-containing protein, partial [Spirochaetales bacterium]|nr:FecR domain-containing protein [Spirochaetales bacterium]
MRYGKEGKSMPENQRDDLKMERLIARARTAPDLREGTKDRILAGFDSIGRGKGRKRNPFQYLRYHPRAFLIIVIPFFLLLSVWGAYRIVHVPREYYSPLVFSSGEAHRTGTPETPLAPGDEIGEDDTVTVAPDDVCDLGLDDTPVFRFFPSSRFTVTDNTASTDRLVIRLEAGSLYINRDPEKAGVKKVAIESGNYRFVLEGTRVLFESLPERLDVSCFEGRVRVIAEEDRRLRELFLLLAGEKIGIELGEAKGHYRIDPVTREDIRIDDAFIGFP